MHKVKPSAVRSENYLHNTNQNFYLRLLQDVGTYTDQNFILGQEFESFSQKGAAIESGLNILTSLITLKLNFNPTALDDTFLTITLK